MSIIIPSNSIVSGGFSVDNSCRFDDGSSDTMSRDNGTPTNLKKFSISLWFKRTEPGLNKYLITGFDTEDNRALLQFSSDQLLFQNQTGGSNNTIIKSNAVFRDSSAWYHFCIIVDTTQGTDTNRVKMYVNGSQVTSLASSTYPSVNTDLELTDSANSILLNQKGDGSDFNSGYYSEVVVLDGTAASITDFGEFDEDSGIWKPINVSGLTFGNNGFYLDFKDSANLGNDANGGTDFTESGLAATDQSTDTCTNNFATWNPLSSGNNASQNHVAFSDGNTTAVGNSSSNNGNAYSTIGVNTGKFYCEMKATGVRGGGYPNIGVMDEDGIARINGGTGQIVTQGGIAYLHDGRLIVNNTDTGSWGATYTDNDIVNIAMDLTNGAIYFGKNGTYQDSGNPTSGSSKTGAAYAFTPSSKLWFAGVSVYESSSEVKANFGNPTFTGTDKTDGNGYGSFEYEPPSGYFALCTKNLAEYG